MINIGKLNRLIVETDEKIGYYLVCPDKQSVFLPRPLAKKNLKIGDEVEVFVYHQSIDSTVATTNRPKAEAGEFAYLKVLDTTDFGAFLDLGIEKHLLVPGNEQKIKMKTNEFYMVRVCLDDDSRLFGTSKLGQFFESENISLIKNQEVSIVPYSKGEIGYSVIIDNIYKGMIYNNEIFENIILGCSMKGYVNKIRPDKLVDVSIKPSGLKNITDSSELIFQTLQKDGGFIALNDKSSPDEIKAKFKISKQNFKKAIGVLYNARKIDIEKEGIRII